MTRGRPVTGIKVSCNELSVALKRAFEGHGFANGAYEDAAAMVLWLQVCGLNGLPLARRSWPQIKPCDGLQVESDDLDNTVLDAAGASIAACGPAVADLAFANAQSVPLARVQLRNCRHRLLIIRALQNGARHGCPMLAMWNDDRQVHSVRFAANSLYPAYACAGATSSHDQNSQTLLLRCGPDINDCYQPAAGAVTTTPQQYRARFARARENGVRLARDDWDWLIDAAQTILVQATERSRAGAGE